jgi:hypothetical protein
LRLQIGLLVGRNRSDFGEKQADARAEFRGRYYF